MGNIITSIFDRLKLTNPYRNEKAGYFLMHDAETDEVSAVPEAAILAKVNSRIDGIIYPDGFTKTTAITRVGNTVSIAPYDFAWRIQLNPYTNDAAYSKTLDATASGELKRIDTLAATTLGTIVYYKGEEDEFIIKPPRILTTELRITDIEIFGDTVQDHTEPFISEVYTLAEKQKLSILDATSDINKPVSTAQSAADADTLTAANSYTDSKVVSLYKYKGNKENYAALPSLGNVTGDVWNVLNTDINWAWTGTVWDNLGGTFDISGKQDVFTETNFGTFENSLTAKATPIDADLVSIIDTADSNKAKKTTFTQLKEFFKSYFDTLYKIWVLDINSIPGITYTIGANDYNKIGIFSNANPVAFTVPTDVSVSIPIGTSFEYVVQGLGSVAVGGAGITFVQSNLNFVTGNSFFVEKIAANTWVVNGTILNEPKVKGVYFVSSFGDDSTAFFENPNKSYLTLNAAVTAFLANANASYIQIVTPSVFSLSIAMHNGTARPFDLRSDVNCTVNITHTGEHTFLAQSVYLDIQKGTLNFNPTTLGGGLGRSYIDIKTNVLEFSATYKNLASGTQGLNITTNTLNVKITDSSGISSGSPGLRNVNIKAANINFTGVSYLVGNFTNLILDFDSLVHNNTFLISPNGFVNTTIKHGNISSIAPYVNTTNFVYVHGVNLNILYKNISSVSSNISINRFNTSGTCVISGYIDVPNSNSLITGNNNNLGLSFVNANIRVKQLMTGNDNLKLITVNNSSFEILGGYFITYGEQGTGRTYDQPSVLFKGVNNIIITTDGANISTDETVWVSVNQPQWDIKNAIIYTNGLISTGVNLVKRNLNQYNSTTIIP
jgi:hypothetical protein